MEQKTPICYGHETHFNKHIIRQLVSEHLFKCPCGLAYIGKTNRQLKTRIAEHHSTIRNQVSSSLVAVHFAEAKHNVSTLKYIGIESLKQPRRGGDLNSMLLKRELFWIFTLDTLSPRGLNEDFDIRPFS